MSVILNTSLGDIVIDLHADLCPLTSKNFLKLCKLKYYNNCLFHDVKKDFIAQTGDPNGTGSGGDSVYKFLYGDQARFFNDEIHPKLTHDKIGTVSMASAGENLNASQFYITLRAGLDYLDGKHTVFGEVAEGLDTLLRINEAYVDDKGRPYKNIRIKHVDILDDPFDDPPQLADLIPDKSPEINPPREGEEVRLEDDWIPMDEQMDPEELDKSLRKKEAHSRAVVLEMIGDIPEAEIAPPENVLFICKLNPVTEEDDLKVIFARFGKIVAADIIRDYKTGNSLCYGFIEFESKEACEAAYFKMDNVLIDDRRIHVDFSQSVAKLWNRFRKFGATESNDQGAGQPQKKGGGCFNCGEYGHLKKDCPKLVSDVQEDPAPTEKHKYTLKDSAGQRGNPQNRYEMVFEEKNDGSDSDTVDVADTKVSHSYVERRSKHRSDSLEDEKRLQTHFARPADEKYSPRDVKPKDRYAGERVDSDDDGRMARPSRHRSEDRGDHSRRNGRARDRSFDDKAQAPLSREEPDDSREHSRRSESEIHMHGKQENSDIRKRTQPLFSTMERTDDRRDRPHRNEVPKERIVHNSPDEDHGRSMPSRERFVEQRDALGRTDRLRNRDLHSRADSDDRQKQSPPPSSREHHVDRAENIDMKRRFKERNTDTRLGSDEEYEKRVHPRLSSKEQWDDRRRSNEKDMDGRFDSDKGGLTRPQSSRDQSSDKIDKFGKSRRSMERTRDGRLADSDRGDQRRARSPFASRRQRDERRETSTRNVRGRKGHAEDSDDEKEKKAPRRGFSTREWDNSNKDKSRRGSIERLDSGDESPRVEPTHVSSRDRGKNGTDNDEKRGSARDKKAEVRAMVSDEENRKKSPSLLSPREQQNDRQDTDWRIGKSRIRNVDSRTDSENESEKRVREKQYERREGTLGSEKYRDRDLRESHNSDEDDQKRARPTLSSRGRQDDRSDASGRTDRARERYTNDRKGFGSGQRTYVEGERETYRRDSDSKGRSRR